MKIEFKSLDKATYAKEKRLLVDLRREYKVAYESVQRELAFYISKYGDDGKMSAVKMAKYNRLESMSKQIAEEIKTLNKVTARNTGKYLEDIYTFNYYQTAFTLETTAQKKLAYGLINRQAVAEATMRPMTQIALADNAQTVQMAIQRVLTQTVAQGLSVKDASRLVRQALNKNSNNATRIVRTETTGIMNKAREESMLHAQSKGLEIKKFWVATLDDRTRDRHAELDGETQDIDKPFTNGLMYPGDQSGDAEDTINCRCSQGTDIGLERAERRTGAEVIPYTTYSDWEKNRLS